MSSRPPTLAADFELSSPTHNPVADPNVAAARLLCRLHGQPIGIVDVPVVAGRVAVRDVAREMLQTSLGNLATLSVARALRHNTVSSVLERRVLADDEPPGRSTTEPLVTVAVCTRDRTDDLRTCLEALVQLDYGALDLLVVDNAPSGDATRALVEAFPQVRYVREPRPGLDWARTRAVLECRGEFIAFTDDDVVVDRLWVRALVDAFALAPDVMAVTGLVAPYALETEAQRLFEHYGGFGRGVMRRWYRAPASGPLATVHGGTGKFGTGANMAFRRTLFDHVGGFDPALDVGTCTNGGGDLEMFFRVLAAGHTLVYEPSAIVRHRHRATYERLRVQVANNGVGFFAYLTAAARAYPRERWALARFGVWWFLWWSVRRAAKALLGRERVPLDLVVAESIGSMRGLFRYRRAVARARETAARHPLEPSLPPRYPAAGFGAGRETVIGVDLDAPLRDTPSPQPHDVVRVRVSYRTRALGAIAFEHQGASVSRARLIDEIAAQLPLEALDAHAQIGPALAQTTLSGNIWRTLTRSENTSETGRGAITASDEPISIVVATYDRPDDLGRCLSTLTAQRIASRVEIIVVDNHPASGVTPPVVERFPGVRLMTEERGGLSYARNRGILAATGSIIATTDDDVSCPPDWLERLIEPFDDADVMAVTGNVLPLTLESAPARMFEHYGGLGRGFAPKRVDAEWFRRWRRAAPTWELGCTANAAFRASIFRDARIGLMHEALGAGTPTGCSEDTYTFYRILNAGFAIVYEPRAWVWHKHRDSMDALRRQIYAYAKGHAAYQLTTWLRDGDRRGLLRLAVELPLRYAERTWQFARRRSDYPLSFIALEIAGTLAGPFALWRSVRRVRRLGRIQSGTPAPLPASPSTRRVA
jgi:O-antigen biosynthesis protein